MISVFAGGLPGTKRVSVSDAALVMILLRSSLPPSAVRLAGGLPGTKRVSTPGQQAASSFA